MDTLQVPAEYPATRCDTRGGGREANGAQLYIARVKYYYGVHTAKCGEHLVGAYMPALSSGTEYIMNVCAESDDVFSVAFYR